MPKNKQIKTQKNKYPALFNPLSANDRCERLNELSYRFLDLKN